MKFNSTDKIQSRIDTIITPYKSNISDSLESDNQYWTLCADCTIKNSEYDQMTNCGFIKPHQFYGVDIDLNTIELNKSKIHDSTFIHGDFFKVMATHKNYNPGIVNMDCLNTFETEKNNIKRVFLLLQKFNNVLLNINVLLGNYNVKERNPLNFINFISEDTDMNYLMIKNKWSTNINAYTYKGLGSVTKMMSIGLIKK